MDRTFETLTSFHIPDDAVRNPQAYDASLKSYLTVLGQLSGEAKDAVVANPTVFLEALNPSVNSIGFLAVLDILLNTSDPAIDRTTLLDYTVDFLLKFEPCQVRYVGSSMLAILELVASGSLFSDLVAVELLATAILRIDRTGTMFTSTHFSLAKLAYNSNHTEPALKVLDRDITSFPIQNATKDSRPLCDPDLPPVAYISEMTGQFKSQTILEYNLLRGLIYTSRQDWSQAQLAFEQVIAHPSKDRGVSKIQSETHKKWVLVGLLNTGKPPVLPTYTSSVAKSSYAATNKAYVALARAFDTPEAAKLRTEAEENQTAWEDDGNMSLVAEVLSAYQKWQIIHLRRIYHRVSVSQIRNMTFSGQTGEALSSDEDVVTLIQSMLDSGMLKGSLATGPNADESYLSFQQEGSAPVETDFAGEIARCHQSIERLTGEYRLASERLASSKEYVRYMAREQRRADKEGADAGIGFDSQIEDEDLMTGVMAHA